MTKEEKLKVKYAETKTQENTDSVADLEVNSEQGEEIQAGAETKSGGSGTVRGYTGTVHLPTGDGY